MAHQPHLTPWAMHKFKRFRGQVHHAMAWLLKVCRYQAGLLAQWQLVAFTVGPAAGRMTGDRYVRC
jgi:hypothetical protein